MEGLIKGLINVASDAIDGDGEQEQRRNQVTSTQEGEVDERSRATWAEVSFNLLLILELNKVDKITFQ
jgi:hypothetical protein